MDQPERHACFRALHDRPGGFVMPNAWDAASALLLKEAGFEALGTSSAAIAAGLGRRDGRHALSLAEHLANARLLAPAGLPLNGDFEDGYGATPADVARTVEAAVDAGLAGIGIEDTSGDPAHPIRPFDEAVARVAAAAKAARGRIVLTGRTDNYLQGNPDLADTVRRLTAFAEVGADVLYAPYPTTLDDAAAIVRAVAPKPVNLVLGSMAGAPTLADLRATGARRISLGVTLYARAMAALKQDAHDLAAGTLGPAATALSFGDIMGLVDGAPAPPPSSSPRT